MKFSSVLLIVLALISCQSNDESASDIIIHNAKIYTATEDTLSTAIAIKGDKITLLGDNETILNTKGQSTQIIDANGHFLMPGIIEGHGHFSGFGKSLQNLNFLADTSWQQIVDKVVEKAAHSKKGEWIYGRGWHQEKWAEQHAESYGGYPIHHSLSELTPDNPVILSHASGHGVYANKKAMEIAGINAETPDPVGGKIIKESNKQPIGVFEENAMHPIQDAYNSYLENLDAASQEKVWMESISLAQDACLQQGITSFQDAGATFEEITKYATLANNKDLNVRLWSMIRDKKDLFDNNVNTARQIGTGDNFFTCRAIKAAVDGALGAHGAWLLEPYADKPGFYGQNTTSIEDIEYFATVASEHDMQLCVHAIGDRANKEVLDIIESYKSEPSRRWRVEHAQHLNPADIMRFKSTGAIASMQGIHCTSDAPFVEKRLGFLRAKVGAYAWKALLNEGVTIVNGTDVPVEKIDPFANFYASVTRTRADNGFKFFTPQRMSREQALKSYTINAAYGAFEDDIKGSLESGKLADLILLDKNLMTCDDMDILSTKVLYTIVGGEIKYKK